MVFPVVMCGCESWTVKKAEHRRIDAFELWCWRRLLRVPWTARRSNQSILKISPGCSLEGMMLKLKLQYFGYLMWRIDIKKDPNSEKDWRQEKGTTENEMVGWYWQLMDMSFNKLWDWWWTEKHGVLQSMRSKTVRDDWVAELNTHAPY